MGSAVMIKEKGGAMNRRAGRRLVFSLIVLLCGMRSSARSDDLPVQVVDPSRTPNVVMIAVDDLNDWVGCLGGHPQALTPNIDRLARRGILFSNAHCPSTACNPSRAAIFSGQWPWRTSVWNNKSPRLFSQHPDIHVLPRWLKEQGYQTFGTGKLMHSSGVANRLMFDDSFNPEQRWSPFTKDGVRYRDTELPTKGTVNPFHEAILPTGEKVVLPLNRMPSDRNPAKPDGESFDWGGLTVLDDAMGDTAITDWAIERLSEMNPQQPFLLGVGYYRPHIPLFAPEDYFKRFQGQSVTLPVTREDDLTDLSASGIRWALEADTAGLHSTVLKNQQWSAAVKAYLACTTYVDGQIGRLLDTLDHSDFADNTIVVLFSDHGWHLGEKQHWGKWTGWERSTRVPLVIVPAKDVATDAYDIGGDCKRAVNLIDLYPTVCELCGVPSPDGLDGRSLVPLMQEVQSQMDRRSSLSLFDQGNYSLRDDRFRYIRYADDTEELYDLLEDPNEWTNLCKSLTARTVLERMRLELDGYVRMEKELE
jgi:arylsulfatase A-like enzyme